jgi:hypothetical protein
VLRFEHHSDVLSCEMKFSVFLPSQAQEGQKVPVREPPPPQDSSSYGQQSVWNIS